MSVDPGAIIDGLYQQIPAMQCKPGCTDCCGPILMHPAEWSRFAVQQEADGIDCPYNAGGKCAEYEHRPLVCRLFGAVEKMPCPHGCKPERMLSPQVEEIILRTYFGLFEDAALEVKP